MADIVNDEGFVSKEGKSRYQLWHELCELIAKNPDKVKLGEVRFGGWMEYWLVAVE